MPSWPVVTVRLVAIVNLLFVLVGLCALAFTVFLSLGGHDLAGFEAGLTFYIGTAINLLLLFALIVGSLFLWRFKRLGLLICNAVFASELLYFAAYGLLRAFPSLLGGMGTFVESMAFVVETGNVGTIPQVMTGYPLIGIVLLNIVYRRLRGNKGSQTELDA